MNTTHDNRPIRVLTVDDHHLLREGIAAVLEDQPDMTLVAEASNGREAIASFREHRPDVTLMDLRMPDMSGIEAIAAIRAEFPNARIVVLTTYTGDVQAAAALKAGAAGYLLKSSVGKELLETIRSCTQVSAGCRRRSRLTSLNMWLTTRSLSVRSRSCAGSPRAGQQKHRPRPRHIGKHRQGAHSQHSAEAQRQRSHARRNDCAEAGHPRYLTTRRTSSDVRPPTRLPDGERPLTGAITKACH